MKNLLLLLSLSLVSLYSFSRENIFLLTIFKNSDSTRQNPNAKLIGFLKEQDSVKIICELNNFIDNAEKQQLILEDLPDDDYVTIERKSLLETYVLLNPSLANSLIEGKDFQTYCLKAQNPSFINYWIQFVEQERQSILKDLDIFNQSVFFEEENTNNIHCQCSDPL
jgi:hypothetical protein